jgi:hypothetical protein
VRYFRGERLHEVRPVTVVEDADDHLVLWLAGGTPMIRSGLADGRAFAEAPLHERYALPVARSAGVWSGTGIVMVVPPSGAYSVWLFWSADGAFLGWYGNLEEPHVRWSGGLDTADQHLDVWVTPDRGCEWRDEDEFGVATDLPDYWTAGQVPAIRAEGERLIAWARAGEPPFDGRWVDFRPDPAWPVPELPTGWQAPRHRR